MRESFDIPLGIVSFVVSFVLLVMGLFAFDMSLSESEKVSNQLSVFKTDTQQQLSVLSQKLDEKEKKVLIYCVKKQEESNGEDKVECAIPY